MRLLPFNALLILLPALALPVAAEAQAREWSGVVAVGAGAPDYMGSNDLEATPYAAGRINYGAFYLDFQGQQVRLNVSLIEGWASNSATWPMRPTLAMAGSRPWA